MTGGSRWRAIFHGDGNSVDVDRLIRRTGAMRRFVDAAGPHVPDDDLRSVRAVLERVDGRLEVSRDHTVVALAGATGSGKSSLFNALIGRRVSDVGVRRPTTADAYAGIWGDEAAADDLLAWLDVPAGRRIAVDAESETAPELAGLVLLDLPDIDSVRAAHRREADRLIERVDLVIWVTDPQKYADQVIHHQYLRVLNRHVDTTVVVLNQADRLDDDDLRRCVTDLTALLAADGYPKIRVLALSATTDPPGVAALRTVVGRTVAERRAMLRRLAADVESAAVASRSLLGDAPAKEPISHRSSAELAAALAVSAGVPAVADATDQAYRFRARASIGWPLIRWIRRLRIDPLVRLRLGIANAGRADVSSLSAPSSPSIAVADLAVRALVDDACHGLPVVWTDAVTRAAREHRTDLPDALDRAVVATDLGVEHKRRWWRAVGAAQWALTVFALAGGVWLLVRLLLLALGLGNLGDPGIDLNGGQRLPYASLALIGGALAGIALTVVTRPLVAFGARRARRRASARLSAATADVGREFIEAPVRRVLDAYAVADRTLRDLDSA
ncbi:MAG TPA: GTPase [Micromonosporaceae bacterium]